MEKKTHYHRQKNKSKKQYYYAVKQGFKPGVYTTWDECKEQTTGYPKPIFKKFLTEEDANCFVSGEYFESDIKIGKEFTSRLHHGLYNPDNDYPIDCWNKYGNKLYLFTDGSERKLEYKKISRLGIYIGELALNINQAYPNATNNRCELLAIQYSLEIIDKNKKEIKAFQKLDSGNESYLESIVVVSDSEYCINSCSNWIYGWQCNGWKTKANKDILNQDIMKGILFLLNKLKLHSVRIEFLHVNSHQPPPLNNASGIFLWKGNQIADLLAQDKM